MLGRFDDDFVSAKGAHFVVNAFGGAAGIDFDPIKGLRMRNDANAPGTLTGGRENRL